MRLLICGSRNWENYTDILIALKAIKAKVDIECVIEGEARGADTLARVAAEHLNLAVLKFPADWEIGKAAGSIRNQLMLNQGQPTHALAFSVLPDSGGTGDMVRRLQAANVPVAIFTNHQDLLTWLYGNGPSELGLMEWPKGTPRQEKPPVDASKLLCDDPR